MTGLTCRKDKLLTMTGLIICSRILMNLGGLMTILSSLKSRSSTCHSESVAREACLTKKSMSSVKRSLELETSMILRKTTKTWKTRRIKTTNWTTDIETSKRRPNKKWTNTLSKSSTWEHTKVCHGDLVAGSASWLVCVWLLFHLLLDQISLPKSLFSWEWWAWLT